MRAGALQSFSAPAYRTLTFLWQIGEMFIASPPSATDQSPDDEALRAMRAALRDFKAVTRKRSEHPQRAEMLSILNDARAMIDRINQPTS